MGYYACCIYVKLLAPRARISLQVIVLYCYSIYDNKLEIWNLKTQEYETSLSANNLFGLD